MTKDEAFKFCISPTTAREISEMHMLDAEADILRTFSQVIKKWAERGKTQLTLSSEGHAHFYARWGDDVYFFYEIDNKIIHLLKLMGYKVSTGDSIIVINW